MTYSAEVMADAPAAFWKMAEVSGTTLVDSSGNARDGAWQGAPTVGAPSLIEGEPGSTTFDGVNDQGVVTSATWMNAATFTLEAIVRSDSSNNVPLLARDGSFEFGLSPSDGLYFWLYVTGGPYSSYYVTAYVAPTQAVNHAAVTFDGTNVALWLNGVQTKVETISGGTPASTGRDLYLGAYEGAATYRLAGAMQGVAFYPTALSPARIQAHSAAAVAVAPAPAVTTQRVDRANGRTRVCEWQVDVEPPVTEPKRQRAHDYAVAVSITEPTLVDGRPT